MTRLAFASLLLATACASTSGHGPGDAGPGAPPPPVAYGGEILHLDANDRGFQRPQLDDEGCLGEALRRTPGAAGVENKVRFAVLRDGSLVRFSYLQPVTDAQRLAIETAFAACRWNPGLAPGGTPVAVWVIQPIKVLAAEPSVYR